VTVGEFEQSKLHVHIELLRFLHLLEINLRSWLSVNLNNRKVIREFRL